MISLNRFCRNWKKPGAGSMKRFLCCLTGIILPALCAMAQQKNTHHIDWKLAATLPQASAAAKQLGLAGVMAGVHNNVLILAGGANFPDSMPWMGGKKKFYADVYIFRKDDNGKVVNTGKVFTLPFPLAYGGSCSTPEGVVCIGGETPDGLSRKVLLLRWNALADQLQVVPLPDLPHPVSNAAVTCYDHTIYLAGGETEQTVSAQFLCFNINRPAAGWKALPPLAQPVSHAVLLAQSNGDHPCLYLAGGRKRNPGAISELYSAVNRFDLKTGQWQSCQPLPYALAAGTGVATGASYLLLFGGDKGHTFNQVESLIAAVAKEPDPAKKQRLNEEKIALQSSHPGFSSDVLLYNTITDVWTVTDSIPFAGQVTTTATRWGDDIIIPSGEIKAGVRTPNIVQGTPSRKQFFSWPDIAVLITCFLLMTVARYFFTSHQTTTADYFKGGQRIPQWAAGISIFGAKLSAITFMGIPAKTYASNWTYFFLLMTIIMIMPVVVRFFIPFYRKLNVTSAYEYLDKRFNYGSRLVASLLYVLLQLGRMGIVVLLPSIALTLVTGINVNICIVLIGAISIFFTVKGGIEAVIWVEVIQVLILAGGALFCLCYIPFHLHNAGEAWNTVRHYDKLKVFDFSFDLTTPTFWVVLAGGLAINLVTYGTDQTTVQRYLTTKTEAESVKSLKLGAWLTLPSTLVFFTLGTLLFLFFRQQPEQVNFALNDQDNIFPWYIVSQLPAGISGLLIAGIFAAAMSSTEASMNSVATLLTTDFYRKLRPGVNEKQTLFFARFTTLLLGLFVTGIALYMAQKGISSLWDKFNTILGLFTGCIGGVFLLGIFTRRANGPGVVMGMLISCATQLCVQYFTDIHLLLYAFTGLTSCVFFGYFCSAMFTGKGKDITGLTVYK